LRISLAIALSLVLLLPILGRYAFFLVAEARLEASFLETRSEEYAAEALVWLAFSRREAAELAWEHDREFAYRGTMYDLVERRESTDSLFFLCRPDGRETALYEWWSRAGLAQPDQQHASLPWKHFTDSLFPATNLARPFLGIECGRTVPPAGGPGLPHSIPQPPPVPPPEACLRA